MAPHCPYHRRLARLLPAVHPASLLSLEQEIRRPLHHCGHSRGRVAGSDVPWTVTDAVAGAASAPAFAVGGTWMDRAARGRDQGMPWDPGRLAQQSTSREKSWAGRGWGKKGCVGWRTAAALMCPGAWGRNSCLGLRKEWLAMVDYGVQ